MSEQAGPRLLGTLFSVSRGSSEDRQLKPKHASSLHPLARPRHPARGQDLPQEQAAPSRAGLSLEGLRGQIHERSTFVTLGAPALSVTGLRLDFGRRPGADPSVPGSQ